MLDVPCIRQPDFRSCLPTCCLSVLLWQGQTVTFSEVAEWCHLQASGCDADLAVQGLREAGVDALLRQFESLRDLAEALEEGLAPIVIVKADEIASHAVVVCDVSGLGVVAMDPAIGAYVNWTAKEFEERWHPLQGDTLLIGHQVRKLA